MHELVTVTPGEDVEHDFIVLGIIRISHQAVCAWCLKNPNSRGPVQPVPGLSVLEERITRDANSYLPLKESKGNHLYTLTIDDKGRRVFEVAFVAGLDGEEVGTAKIELGQWIETLVEFTVSAQSERRRASRKKRRAKKAHGGRQ